MSTIMKTAAAVSMVLAMSLPGLAGEIHEASRTGDLEQVKALLENDPQLLNARDDNGMTPLHHASRGVHHELVVLLVEKGADVNAKGPSDVVALHSLAYRDASDLVALVISRGADPDARLVTGAAAIHFAAENGHTDVVEVLVANKADIEATDALGNTPLLLASAAGLEDLVERLVSLGAAVNHENSRGDTPVTVAHREGEAEIVELLIAKGADAASTKERRLPVGAYLGEEPPGTTPALFAPHLVSTERDQLNAVFSPDGTEFYFTQRTPGGSTIMEMKIQGAGWTRPQPAPFSGGLRDVDLFITNDGKRIFFCSSRPLKRGGEPRRDADIWVVSRADKGWAEPKHLGNVVNSEGDDYYPTLADDGTLYLSSRRPDSLGENDVYCSRWNAGGFSAPENIGTAVNSKHREFDPFVAPDHSFIVFASERPDGHGGADLYISFAKPDGSWAEARNMGPEVNSASQDFTPMLSPDGKYLFFTSAREGVSDLFWVDAKVIERMRPR